MLKIWGANYSVYSRVLQLALYEKDIPFDWVETDVFDDEYARAGQEKRHPWAKIPVLEDGDFQLYETRACLAYLEQPRFGTLALVPPDPRAKARAEQVSGIVDAYGYRAMVWDVFVELMQMPKQGQVPDPDIVARGIAESERVLDAIEPLVGQEGILNGVTPSYGDLYLGPVMAYFTSTGPGRAALARRPHVESWWRAWQDRPSMMATRSPLEARS